jgi:mannosyltransferase
VVAVTALLHEFALLLLVAHAVTLLVSRTPSRTLWRWAVAAAAATAALVPLILISHGQEAQVAWIDPPGRRAVRALLYHFAGPSRLVVAVNLGLVAAAVLLRPMRRAGPLGPVAVALPLAAVPPVVLLGVSQWQPLFVGRYVLFALAGVPLLAATGAEVLLRHVRPWLVRPLAGTRRLWPVTVAGVVAIAAAFLWQLPVHERDRQRTSRPDDFAAVAALLHSRTQPGDALLFFPYYQRGIALAYPENFAGLRDVALREPVAVSGTLNGREAGPRVLRARLALAERVWVVALPRVEHRRWFRADTREQAKLAVLRQGFRRVSTTRAYNGTASLFVRK